MVLKAGRKIKVNKESMLNTADRQSLPAITDMLAKAIAYHQKGDLARAETMYHGILKIVPDNADALHLLGVIAYQSGDNSRAVEYIGRALLINPQNSFYHNNMGNALLGLKKTDEAENEFRDAIQLNPDNIEAYNNLGNACREQGEYDEAFKLYSKALELNPDYVAAINNTANLLKDTGRLDEAIMYYRRAIKLKPDFAELYFNLAGSLAESGNMDEAVEQYCNAIQRKPDFAEAYNDMGNVLKKLKRYIEAVTNYQKAITLKSDFTKAYNNLGDCYREQSMFNRAAEQCLKAIQLEPENEKYHVNLGNVLSGAGKYREAIVHYQKAIDLKSDYADAHYNKGLMLLMNGDFENGWREYEWRFLSKEIATDIGCRAIDIPFWDGTPLNDKTILIMSEQGVGDVIQFARYFPLVKAGGGKVLFECNKKIRRLFEGNKNVDMLLDGAFSSDCGADPDVRIYLMSLPGIFQTNINNIPAHIPYMEVAPEDINIWKSCFDQGIFKVGLVWSGNPLHKNDRNRSCKLSDFKPLADIQGVAFYSLQNVLENESDIQVTDIGKDLIDFYDTAAAIENLNLVITVDTAVAHLAGALGKPVWTLLPFVPDWRWMLNRSDTPWYPSMRLFRQPVHGDWASVIEQVGDELKIIIASERSMK